MIEYADNYDCFAVVLTVTDTESEGVHGVFNGIEALSVKGDSQHYYEKTLTAHDGERRLIFAQAAEMGMTASAVLSMKVINHFKPKYLLMTGIAAGISPDGEDIQLYGDVVVADKVWNYSSGKFVAPEKAEIIYGEVGFISRPSMIIADEEMIRFVRKAAASRENQCKVRIGTFACGSTVVANQHILNRQIRTQMQDNEGLDMESYAVMYAAENATEPRPKALIVKSVCDYADSRKDDRFQRFAAHTSAEFTKLLCEKYLP